MLGMFDNFAKHNTIIFDLKLPFCKATFCQVSLDINGIRYEVWIQVCVLVQLSSHCVSTFDFSADLGQFFSEPKKSIDPIELRNKCHLLLPVASALMEK